MAERIFTREELDDLDLPYSFEDTQFIQESRWYDLRLGVVAVDGVFYGIEYCDPKTEMQEDMDPWYDEPQVVGREVKRVPATTYVWEYK